MEKYNKNNWYSNRFSSIEKLISFDFIMYDKSIPINNEVRESIISLTIQAYELNLSLLSLINTIQDPKIQNKIVQLFINYDNSIAYLPLSSNKDILSDYETKVINYKTGEIMFEEDSNPSYVSLSFEETMTILKALYSQIVGLLNLICCIFEKFDNYLEEECANKLYMQTINMMTLLKEFVENKSLISEAEISPYEITENFGLIHKYN